jgi:DNA polymerase elongation subunit (family B)
MCAAINQHEVGVSVPSFALDSNEVLFGADPRPGILAVELLGDRTAELFVRTPGGVERISQPFQPCLWIGSRALLKGYRGEVEVESLAGAGELRFLVTVPGGRELEGLRRHLRQASGETASSRVAPYLYIGDRVHLHLLRTGQTLFKGLTLADLRRLQIDIETDCAPGFEFSNPERDGDRILSIAVTDSTGYEEVIWGGDLEEAAMIERLGEVIQSRDPDVIEGHNLLKFDVEYLRVRAARYNLELRWGRDGSAARSRSSRVQVAERVLDVPRWEVRGRHLIDTWLLVQFYDVTAREFESYALKDVARHLGLADEDREVIDGLDVARVFRQDPERLRRYNLSDAREVGRLAELLAASYFIQAQIFPYSFQSVVVRGNATKINALFLREHLRRKHSVPALPEVDSEIVGGYTAVLRQGQLSPILHADVRSLYPSVMLSYDLRPPRDELDLFLGLLRDLRDFRLAARQAMVEAESEGERRHLDALQSTFKILINSFYGYLGSGFAHWADTGAANEVTGRGREIIQKMIKWLEKRGAEPVEVDTDGVYFVPPPGVGDDDASAEAFVGELSEKLPKGIQVELAGRYRAMLSYKMKNYALLDHAGKLSITGSGLRSRGLERFQRGFLHEMIRLALEGRKDEIPELYERTLERFARHEFHVRDFMKTETLADSLSVYRSKREKGARNRSAAYELALVSGRDLRPGDQLSYYVTGEKKRVTVAEAARPAAAWDPAKPDENTAYYQAKLTELYQKFGPLCGVDVGGQGELKL